MKYFLFTVLTILSQTSYSQKVIENEIDKFTKQHRVRTDRILVRGGFSTNMFIGFRAVDTTCFLVVSGNGDGADVIGDKEQFILLFDNDSTIAAYSTGIQNYTIQSGVSSNTYIHQYSISINDIRKISKNKLKSIRKYGSGHYSDFDIKSKNSEKLAEEARVFLPALGLN
jgi:hypothetical protein